MHHGSDERTKGRKAELTPLLLRVNHVIRGGLMNHSAPTYLCTARFNKKLALITTVFPPQLLTLSLWAAAEISNASWWRLIWESPMLREY